MRVLLDENLPHDLIARLSGQTVSTVQGMGWAGVENGELLRRASGQPACLVVSSKAIAPEKMSGPIAFQPGNLVEIEVVGIQQQLAS